VLSAEAEDLESYYRRFGFEADPAGGMVMLRSPKSALAGSHS
jgi:hypothetical protein